MHKEQCDQISQFLKVLEDRFSNNSCPNIWQLFGLFKNILKLLNFLEDRFSYNSGPNIWQHFGYLKIFKKLKDLGFFISTSGHTELRRQGTESTLSVIWIVNVRSSSWPYLG